MRKVLYYLMVILLLACTVWNALSKKDSIMGTGAHAENNPPPHEMVAISQLP